ncbi:MAG TPA: hydrolase [Syntrophaceae bacterium]|jgi:nicotinamidase-related amidase|nr:hydrolase [Syntrophaceae bacterium]
MLTRNNTVLTIIDVQGNLAQVIDLRDIVIENIRKIIKGCQVFDIPILLTEEINLGPTIPEITDLIPETRPIIKVSFSSCGNEEFVKALQTLERKQVLLAGMETHVCVYQTAVDLIARGYEVQIIADAVSSRSQHNREIALHKMRDYGVIWTSTEMVLFELLKTAADPKLRNIINLVK